MKRHFLCTVLLLLLTCATGLKAQSLEKKISGRFPASKGKLVINNEFGKVAVNTWEKNEVSVEITITAKGRSDDKAQQNLDRISIVEPDDNNYMISYKTVIGKGKINVTNGNRFSIDYVVYMPADQTLEITNKFGDISLPDMSGKLLIDLQYGALKSGSLTGGDKNIRVSFGSTDITNIESGVIKSSYSKLFIYTAGNIVVTNQFAPTTINVARMLLIDQKYGSLSLEAVSKLSGNVQFASHVTVGKLFKSAQLGLKYCSNINFDNIGPDVEKLDLQSSFGKMNLKFDDNTSLAGDLTSSFSELDNNASNVALNVLSAGRTGSSSSYKCKVGTGRGSLSLSCSYGHITIR